MKYGMIVLGICLGVVLEMKFQVSKQAREKLVDYVVELIVSNPLTSLIIGVALALGSIIFIIGKNRADHVFINMDVEDAVDMRDKEQISDAGKLSLQIGNRKDKIVSYNPATGHVLGTFVVDDEEDVERAVARAREAQSAWRHTSFAERRRVLRMMMRAIMERSEDICKISCVDTGKTRMEAMLGEIMVTCEKISWVCDNGEEVLAPEWRKTGLITAHKTGRVVYEPLGVLGVLAPWNYPFHNMYNHIVSGLFTGNAVVIKMSEYAALSADRFVNLAQDVLMDAGYSPDLVQIVQGFAETGAALVKSGVDKVIFTGSPQVGRHIARGASENLTPCVLELGGKDPIVVTDDVIVDEIIQTGLRGAMQNAGQNCIGIERFYVYESVYDEFVDKMVDAASKVRQGAPLNEDGSWNYEVDVGASTTPLQAQHVEELVRDAEKKGAVVHLGGKINKALSKSIGGGIFFQPTVLSEVTHEMRIANEEVFGPVITIIRVPDDSDDAAIAMINSTCYGLGSNVYARDVARAERIASRIRAGMVVINDFALGYMVQALPFGGVNDSGYGRFAGIEGLRACCHLKSVTSDLIPGVRTQLPPPMQYPTSEKSVAFVQGLIDMQYATDLIGRIRGILNLI